MRCSLAIEELLTIKLMYIVTETSVVILWSVNVIGQEALGCITTYVLRHGVESVRR